jgi:hypothetical protein
MEKINSTITDFFILVVITVMTILASRNLNALTVHKSVKPYSMVTSVFQNNVIGPLIHSKVVPVPLNTFLWAFHNTQPEKTTSQELTLTTTNQGVIDYNSTRSNKE